MKSLLFFDNSQSTRCHPPKGKIRAKNELRKTWMNCSSPFPSFFIHTKALFSLQFCAYLHPLTNSALLHSMPCSSAWVCFGSGSWAATAEAVRGNNRLLQVNSAVQTNFVWPMTFAISTIKIQQAALAVWAFQKQCSHVSSLQPRQTTRFLSGETTNYSQPKQRPVPGLPGGLWPFLVAQQPRHSPRVPEHPIPLTELC